MEPGTSELIATTSAPLSPGVGIDIFAIFFNLIGSLGGSGVTTESIADFLGSVWNVYAILAYIFSIIILGLYVYASTLRWHMFAVSDKQSEDMEKLYDAHYRGTNQPSRLSDVIAHIDSANPNDWKLAIIEADIILDDLLKQRGYAGNSLGERLKSISSNQLSSLNDAWEAHKIRNRIAHEGSDFVLTKRTADETINRYRRVFTEFGVT